MHDTLAFEPIFEEQRRHQRQQQVPIPPEPALGRGRHDVAVRHAQPEHGRRRCRRRDHAEAAKILGFSALEIVNLYAWRATDPDELRPAGYPVGEQNDAWIASSARRVAKQGGQVCCAWGVQSMFTRFRAEAVFDLLRYVGASPMALKLTKGGFPAHPLYLSSACKLIGYEHSMVSA